jgi:hypothetical protein
MLRSSAHQNPGELRPDLSCDKSCWNGRSWIHLRFCSAYCESVHELQRYQANAEKCLPVVKNYRRNPDPRPYWHEGNCPENNDHVRVGDQDYMISGDGFLIRRQRARNLRI